MLVIITIIAILFFAGTHYVAYKAGEAAGRTLAQMVAEEERKLREETERGKRARIGE